MALSPRTQIPYPDQNERDWDATFVAMVNAIDYSLFAAREDRNILILGGGTMTFTATTGVLTWGADIQLLSPVSGYITTLAAGSVTIPDNNYFYVQITRGPTSNITVTTKVGFTVQNNPSGDDQFLIGFRKGSIVHFREGFLIGDGQSKVVFDNTTSAGISNLNGDVTGPPATNTVVAIQGRPVTSTAPSLNDTFVWNGAQWGPGSVPTPNGVGDWTGAITSNTVGKINGATVPAAPGAGDAGKLFQVLGAAAYTFALLVNANVDAAAAIAGTKISPNFGSQSVVTTGSGSFASLTTTGDVLVGGNLTVNGTTTTVHSTIVDVQARIEHLNWAAISTAPVPTLPTGIEVERGDNGTTKRDAAAVLWDEAGQLWQFAFQTAANDTGIGTLLPIKALGATLTGLGGSGAGYATVSNTGQLGFASTVGSGAVAPGTAGQVFITNSTPASAWDSTLLITPGSLVTLASGATIKLTQGGTLVLPSLEYALTIQPRDPAKAPFHIGHIAGALFNSTWDDTMAIGYNTDLANADAAVYWRLEQDYEVTPGTHWFEYYIEYFGDSTHRANTFRPIYLNVNKSTNNGQLIFGMPGTSGSIQITDWNGANSWVQIFGAKVILANGVGLQGYDTIGNNRNLATMAGGGDFQVFGDFAAAYSIVRGGTGGIYLETSGPINFADTSAVVRASVETTHGKGTFGGGGTDFKIVLGPQPTNEGVAATIHALPSATAPTLGNYIFAGTATDTYFSAQSATGVLYFMTSGSNYQAVIDANQKRLFVGAANTAAAPFYIDWAAPTTPILTGGTSATGLYFRTQLAGATITFQPDNAASVLQLAGGTQNAIALGANLASVGHIRSPNNFVWMGRNAANTADIQLFLFDTANQLSVGSLSLASTLIRGANTYIDTNFIFLRDIGAGTALTINPSSSGATTVTVAAGVTSFLLNQAAAASDVVPANITIAPQAPFATAVTNLVAGNVIVNIPASVGAGNKYGGLVVEYDSVVTARIGSYSNGAYGAIWFMDAGSPSTGNWAFLGNSTSTYFNGPTSDLYFGIASTYKLHLTATTFDIGTVYSSPQYRFDLNTNAVFHFLNAATSASIVYDAPASDVAPQNLLIEAQAPYSLATIHVDPGDVIVQIPNSISGASKEGGFRLDFNGATTMRAGIYAGGSAYGAIWFMDAGSPTTANFAFLGNQSVTYLNAPAAGTVYISLSGNSSYGVGVSGTTSGLLQSGGLVSTWTIQQNYSSGTGNLNIQQVAPASDVSPGSITLQPQGPWASATINGIAGDVIVSIPATVVGSKYGGLQVRYGGSALATIGAFNNGTAGALYLGSPAASAGGTNYNMYGDATYTIVNGPTFVDLRIANNVKAELSANNIYLGGANGPVFIDWSTPTTPLIGAPASVTTLQLYIQTQTSNLANGNVVLQAQGPWNNVGNTLGTTAGDVIVNTPASVNAGVKYGGFVVEYNGTAAATLGTWQNGTSAALWLGPALTPGANNYTLTSNATSTTLNAPGGGGIIYFEYTGATILGSWTYDAAGGLTTLTHIGVDPAVTGLLAATGDLRFATNRVMVTARNFGNTSDLSLLSTTSADAIVIGQSGTGLVQPPHIILQTLGGWALDYTGPTLLNTAGGLTFGSSHVSGTLTLEAFAASIIQFAGGTQLGQALGATLAAAGHIRTPNNFVWASRNATNTADIAVIATDGSNNVLYDNSIFWSNSGTTSVTLNTGTLLNLGASAVAGTGTIRAQNNTTIMAARNSGNTADIALVATSGNTVVFGDATNSGDTFIQAPAAQSIVLGTTTRLLFSGLLSAATIAFSNSAGAAGALTLQGQNAGGTNNGGSVTIQGGAPSGAGTVYGAVILGVAATSSSIAFNGSWTTTWRDSAANFTIDTTTTDKSIHVTATQSITAPVPTVGRDIDIVIEAFGAGDVVLTILQHTTEKINGVAASYVITVPLNGVQGWKMRSNGTDWYVFPG